MYLNRGPIRCLASRNTALPPSIYDRAGKKTGAMDIAVGYESSVKVPTPQFKQKPYYLRVHEALTERYAVTVELVWLYNYSRSNGRCLAPVSPLLQIKYPAL